MKTRFSIVSIILVAILTLGALGGAPRVAAQGGTPAATQALPELKAKLKIAIIAPSAKNDLAWTQSMVDAALIVQKELGGADKVDVTVSENLFSVPDAAAAARDYASQGYDIVIMHGTQYGETMFEVAKDFPDVSFVWGTASDTGESKGLKNVFAYEARAEEGGYVNGVMAALLSKSGVIGIVGPIEAGDAKLYIDGFEQGATATKAGIKVLKTYIGSFSDTAKATEAAKAQIAQGADVLTGSAQIVPGPITEIQKVKGYWFGTQSNQADGWKDTVVAAQVFDWTDILIDIITERLAGTKGGKAYELSLANGGLDIVFNDNVKISDDVKKAGMDAAAAIESGKIIVVDSPAAMATAAPTASK